MGLLSQGDFRQKWMSLKEQKLHKLTIVHVCIIVAGLFAIFIWGFGEHSVWNHIRQSRRIGQLERSYEQQLRRYQTDSLRLVHITENADDLERVARVEYKMKAPEEILFLVVDTTHSDL